MSKVRVTQAFNEPPRNARALPNVSNLSHRALTAKGNEAYEMPMDKLLEISNEQMRKQDWKERNETEYMPIVKVFARRHPEIVKYGDHNSTQIALEFETPEGLGPMQKAGRLQPDMQDWEMAYDRALAKGKLRLDEEMIKQKRIEEIEKQTDPRGFTEQDLYDMPKERLRALANGVYDRLGPQE